MGNREKERKRNREEEEEEEAYIMTLDLVCRYVKNVNVPEPAHENHLVG